MTSFADFPVGLKGAAHRYATMPLTPPTKSANKNHIPSANKCCVSELNRGFINSLKLELGVIIGHVQPEYQEHFFRYLSAPKSYPLAIPEPLKLSELELEDIASPLLKERSFYIWRMRGQNNKDYKILQEKFEIYLDDGLKGRYTDHRGDVYEGTIIISKWKLCCNLFSPNANMNNMPITNVTIFANELNRDEKEFFGLITRSRNDDMINVYRSVISKFGILKWIKYVESNQLQAIKYFDAIRNDSYMTTDKDSGFESLLPTIRGYYDRGVRRVEYVKKNKFDSLAQLGDRANIHDVCQCLDLKIQHNSPIYTN